MLLHTLKIKHKEFKIIIIIILTQIILYNIYIEFSLLQTVMIEATLNLTIESFICM